jgi:hypothetical protein
LLDGVYVTLVALLGHGLGWILRNTAGAIATLLGLLLVVPVIFTVIPAQALHDVVAWLPSQAGHDMIDLGPLRSGHSPAVAFVVALAYPAVALVAGGVLLVRRDA